MSEAAIGWIGAVDGMQRAERRADAAVPSWSDQAYAALRAYCERRTGETVIAPTVRAWAHGVMALPEPPTAYAWGGVFLRARRNGLLKPAGYEQYGDKTMHTQSVRSWRIA